MQLIENLLLWLKVHSNWRSVNSSLGLLNLEETYSINTRAVRVCLDVTSVTTGYVQVALLVSGLPLEQIWFSLLGDNTKDMRDSTMKAGVNSKMEEAFNINDLANDVNEHKLDHRPIQVWLRIKFDVNTLIENLLLWLKVHSNWRSVNSSLGLLNLEETYSINTRAVRVCLDVTSVTTGYVQVALLVSGLPLEQIWFSLLGDNTKDMRDSTMKAGVNAKMEEAFNINDLANDVNEHKLDHRPIQGC
ncbi:C-5 cytosine methyltransferase [Artemisia annua]|uniref:C-5 cytosine methyltransferase n=1 Tax=Artemisia annua TaxID=35608 RepID=A0A2U1L532_ARTAN|nr:C-5 cytosine methyltransferase [Artemisia annua]